MKKLRKDRQNRIIKTVAAIEYSHAYLDDWGFSRINGEKHLKPVNTRYSQDIRWLEENGFLEVDHSYNTGVKPKGYRLLSYPFGEPPPLLDHPDDPCPYNALLSPLSINLELVPPKDRELPAARRWATGRLVPAVRKRFRLYNQLTASKKTIRQGLHINGEQLVEVDIKTAQPFFLAAIAKDKELLNNVLTGDFYSFFTMTRKMAKQYWGRLIHAKKLDKKKKIFDKHNYRSWWANPCCYKEKFATEFPTATDYIQQHIRFIRAGIETELLIDKLCRLESELIVDRVMKHFLQQNIPSGSVHDGVICHPDGANIAAHIIKEHCQERFNVHPQIHKRTLRESDR